jgi:hypothetical protein
VFEHPDVVAHALSMRWEVLRDVVGIVAGYLASKQLTPCIGGTRYPQWDRMVRQPLVWTGAHDPAKVFQANAEQSESVRGHKALLHALRALFGHREFKASEVASAACEAAGEANALLQFALESLSVRYVNQAKSVGAALRTAVGRVAEIDGHMIKLIKSHNSHDKIDMFRVEANRG